MDAAKTTYRTIVHPAIKRGTPPRNMVMSDYVIVPRLSTQGHWRLVDLISNSETLLALLKLRKRLEMQSRYPGYTG